MSQIQKFELNKNYLIYESATERNTFCPLKRIKEGTVHYLEGIYYQHDLYEHITHDSVHKVELLFDNNSEYFRFITTPTYPTNIYLKEKRRN